MVNALLLLSPIGMIIVGLAAIIFWKAKKKVAWKYFGYGALLWVLAIIPKVIMDLTITPPIYGGLYEYGTAALVIGAGFYIGLRTGFFESGFTYIAARKIKSLKKIKLNEALAFGIGFGGAEAIIIGISGFFSLLLFVLDPSLASLLTPAQQAALDSPTIIVGAAIMERVFAIFIHVFASLLVFYSLAKKRISYLAYSIIFKAAVDGTVPALTFYIDTSTVAGTYLIELPFLALAFISYLGTLWLMKRY
jgi:uncharacterized membrane protein YhfC